MMLFDYRYLLICTSYRYRDDCYGDTDYRRAEVWIGMSAIDTTEGTEIIGIGTEVIVEVQTMTEVVAGDSTMMNSEVGVDHLKVSQLY